MEAKLYSFELSHPSHAARLCLERKGIPFEPVEVLAGVHPVLVRAAGFRGGTVPALKLDGRRIQGSLAIARELERLRPEPSLYPRDPERRRAVEEAERWGEAELQNVPRRFFRWAATNSHEVRRWLAEVVGVPAPAVMAWLNLPIAYVLGRMVGADEQGVRSDLAALPGKLDHVDRLIAEGVIGRPEPNAADFQIGTTVRVLMAFDDLRPRLEGRPCAELGMRILPDYPGPIRPVLPPAWL